MTSIAEQINRIQANHLAAQIRQDLDSHKGSASYASLAAHYQELGYGLDGYPASYPDDLKNLT